MATKKEVKVHASRKGGKTPGRKLRRTVIEHGANGGHTVRHEYEAPKGKRGMMMPYEEPESFPFSNKQDTMNHLDSTLEGPSVMGKQGAGEPDGDEGQGEGENEGAEE
jgi:hypothetical protein